MVMSLSPWPLHGNLQSHQLAATQNSRCDSLANHICQQRADSFGAFHRLTVQLQQNIADRQPFLKALRRSRSSGRWTPSNPDPWLDVREAGLVVTRRPNILAEGVRGSGGPGRHVPPSCAAPRRRRLGRELALPCRPVCRRNRPRRCRRLPGAARRPDGSLDRVCRRARFARSGEALTMPSAAWALSRLRPIATIKAPGRGWERSAC